MQRLAELYERLATPIIQFATDHPTLTWSVMGGAILASLVGVLLLPWAVVQIPPDYFIRKPQPFLAQHHPVIRFFMLLLKNVAGVVFILAGLVMLITPGPGIIGILVGILMLNFPYKRAVERRLVANRVVMMILNKMRLRYDHPPLVDPRTVEEEMPS
jgi:hypothetical protein